MDGKSQRPGRGKAAARKGEAGPGKGEGSPVSIYFPAADLKKIDGARETLGRDGGPLSRSAYIRIKAMEGANGLFPADRALIARLSVQLRRAGVNLNSLIRDARLAPYRGEDEVSPGRARAVLEEVEVCIRQIKTALGKLLPNSDQETKRP